MVSYFCPYDPLFHAPAVPEQVGLSWFSLVPDLAGPEVQSLSPLWLLCSAVFPALGLSAFSWASQTGIPGEVMGRFWSVSSFGSFLARVFPSISSCFGSPKFRPLTPQGRETAALRLVSVPHAVQGPRRVQGKLYNAERAHVHTCTLGQARLQFSPVFGQSPLPSNICSFCPCL